MIAISIATTVTFIVIVVFPIAIISDYYHDYYHQYYETASMLLAGVTVGPKSPIWFNCGICLKSHGDP